MQYGSQGDLILRLVGRTQPESRKLPRTAFPSLTYAAEQELDPRADFANQPKSQGLLGLVVFFYPSGASWVLDRHAPCGLLAIYLDRE